MASSVGNVQLTVKPFNGTSFSNWEFRMKLLLEQYEVLEVVNMEPPTDPNTLLDFKKNDLKARNIIVQCLADNVLELVKNKTTAKEIMDTLAGTYKKQGLARQVQLQSKLRNMKYSGMESLNDFIINFETTVSELKNCGGNISDSEVITQLLSVMPESYQSVTTAIDIIFCQQAANISLDFVKSKLLMEETRQKKNQVETSTSSAFVIHKKKVFKDKFPFKCYNCGMKGHKKTDCKKLKMKDNRHLDRNSCNISEKDDEIAFLTSTASICSSNNNIPFVVDSGATNHLVTEDIDKFMFETKFVKYKIKVAKQGEMVEAYKEGSLYLQTLEGRKIKLEKVLVCKNLSHNLLSVKRVEEKGLRILFENGKIKIQKNNYEVIASGISKANLYILNLQVQNLEANVTTSQDDLWHRRMGHSSKYPTSKVCEICLQGKQTKEPYRLISDERKPKRIMEVVSTDVCGPINPISHDNKRYFVTFIDHFSHFAAIYFMTYKNEVYDKFKEYVALVENKFQRAPMRLRCDNGGEYVSKEFRNFCSQKGIHIEYTMPYNPQQNGLAERYNRTIMEKARCLIFDAQIEKEFWKEAVATSVYLINRTETSTLSNHQTPAESWYKQKPNLEKIRVFGCYAFKHIPIEERKGKLDPRSKKYIMVGYTDNGYQLWDSENRKILTARNVIFDESQKVQNVEFKLIEDENHSKNELQEEKNDNVTEEIPEEKPLENKRTSNRKSVLPKRYEEYDMSLMMALSVSDFAQDIPESYKEASANDEWKSAINEELLSLEKNETWKIVPEDSVPDEEKIIDSKWIFREKEMNGKKMKKARLVARGYQQSEISEEIYAPVARMVTLRILLSLSIQEDMEIHQLDVKCAFLNGVLNKPVYMKIPEGLKASMNSVCKLYKALYGLRQSPKCWYDKLNSYLLELGFQKSKSDPCFYFTKSSYLLIHVDDIIIVSKSSSEVLSLKNQLMKTFEMRDFTKESDFKFLGLNISKTKDVITINQRDLIQKVLKIFNMSDCKSAEIPIQSKLNLESTTCEFSNICNKNYPYRELIGYLMYIMLGSRPDLCYCINYFSKFQNCYTEKHWKYLKNVLRYLKTSQNFGLKYTRSKNSNLSDLLTAYVDSDYANDVYDRKSVSGFVLKVYDNVVLWKTKKQSTVSLSSAEAEYIALSSCLTEVIFIKQLLEDCINCNIGPVSMFEDNQSCIKMASTLETKRTKHIDVKHHFIRNCVFEGVIILNYIQTSEQIADMFTKSLANVKFKYFRDKLNVISVC